MDVRDERAVETGVDHVHTRLGGLDVLVNDAGIGMRTVNPRLLTESQPFWTVSPAGLRDVVGTTWSGPSSPAGSSLPGPWSRGCSTPAEDAS